MDRSAVVASCNRQVRFAAAVPARFFEVPFEIVIDASIKAVYQKTLVNVDRRPEWLDGVDTIDREMISERINMRHNLVALPQGRSKATSPLAD